MIAVVAKQLLKAQEIHTVESGKAKLVLKLCKKEKAETIFILHGGRGAPTEFSEEINHLQDKFQIINFDQRWGW